MTSKVQTPASAAEELFGLVATSPDVKRFLALYRRLSAYQRRRWPPEKGFDGPARLRQAVEIAATEGVEAARGFFFAKRRQLTKEAS